MSEKHRKLKNCTFYTERGHLYYHRQCIEPLRPCNRCRRGQTPYSPVFDNMSAWRSWYTVTFADPRRHKLHTESTLTHKDNITYSVDVNKCRLVTAATLSVVLLFTWEIRVCWEAIGTVDNEYCTRAWQMHPNNKQWLLLIQKEGWLHNWFRDMILNCH